MLSLPERDAEMLRAVEDATRSIGVAKQARADAVRVAMEAGIPRRLIMRAAGIKQNTQLYRLIEASKNKTYHKE